MTREEFYAKYGDVKVKFVSYYKYTFTYRATLPDGKVLTCGVGGNSDDIYRHDVDAETEVLISSLEAYSGAMFENGLKIEGFYQY